MKKLEQYFKLQQEIYDYFGYHEDWCIIPMDDCTRFYWRLTGTGPGTVQFAETIEQLESEGDYCENEIWTQRFLPKWVYRGKDYTMVVVDPHTDGNHFLQIFDNEKEYPAQKDVK